MNYQCAMITGASSGIGAATARALAAKGMNLVLVARRKERLIEMATKFKKEYDVSVQTVGLDVRESQDLAKLVDLKKVDVLVNNAGLARGIDKVQDAKPEDFDEMIDVNVTALLKVTRQVLPHMIELGRGHIVNIGSVAGRWTYPGGAVYCATKHAVRAFSEGLRMDLLGTPVRVTNIEPGMVETEFSDVRLGDAERAKSVYRGMTPLSPGDIADTIVWSLSRPLHVTIQEMVIFPTDQASIGMVHRRDSAKPS